MNGVDRIDPVFARRIEPELPLDRVEECAWHLLPNPHGAVALHVAVAADGGCSSARLPDVAAQ